MRRGFLAAAAVAVVAATGAQAYDGRLVRFPDPPMAWGRLPTVGAPGAPDAFERVLYGAGIGAVGEFRAPAENSPLPVWIPARGGMSYLGVCAGPAGSGEQWIVPFREAARPSAFAVVSTSERLACLARCGLSTASFVWRVGDERSPASETTHVYLLDAASNQLIDVIYSRSSSVDPEAEAERLARSPFAAPRPRAERTWPASFLRRPAAESDLASREETDVLRLASRLGVPAPAPSLPEEGIDGLHASAYDERGSWGARFPGDARVERAFGPASDVLAAEGESRWRFVAARLPSGGPGAPSADLSRWATWYLEGCAAAAGIPVRLGSASVDGEGGDESVRIVTRFLRDATAWSGVHRFRRNGPAIDVVSLTERGSEPDEGLLREVRFPASPPGTRLLSATEAQRLLDGVVAAHGGILDSAGEARGQLYVGLASGHEKRAVEAVEGALGLVLDAWNRIRARRGEPETDALQVVESGGATRLWRRQR